MRFSLLIVLLISSLGVVWLTQYVTVFYGIPVWKNSSVQAFGKTPNTNLWASTNCIPDDEPEGTIAEVPIPNITEKFDAWGGRNPLVAQAESNIHLLFESTLKPCVKLTPMCIKMQCHRLESHGRQPTTTPRTLTTKEGPKSVPFNITQIEKDMEKEEAMNCSYAMAGYRRDVKKNYSSVWYDQEVVCETTVPRNRTNSTRQVGCYMIHCNDSVIKEACAETYWDTFRLRYCAPAGYALLRCRDTDYSGHKDCSNVSVSACTRLINTTISTGIGINGSYVANRTEIWQENGNSNDTVIIRLNRHYNLTIRCRRPGNKTVLPVTIMAGLVFHSQKYNTKLKQAWCWFGGHWRSAWQGVEETIVELPKDRYSGTNDTSKIFLHRQWGDPETEFFFFNCQGEFFYCKMDWFLNGLNNQSVDPDHNNCTKQNDNKCWQRTYVPCHIRQVVNDWYTLSKKTYAPPREGHLECNSTATALYVELNYNSKNRTNVTLSPQIRSIWANELGDYKLVEIKPIGFAPTEVRRYTGPERQERVPFVLGFLGFLGAAGATMGAAATTLTVQSQQLLAGILQQQKNLLAAVEQQQQMLKLTIWGVKNLNARVTALEKYLEDQARLNIWGCAFRQVCHTTVPWKFNNTPDWENMTWQEWEKSIASLAGNISNTLAQAHEHEQNTLDQYQKLVSWPDFWSWLDLSKWFGWLKIAVMVIAGMIVARVLFVVISLVRKSKAGYAPLSSLPSYNQQIHIHLDKGQPDKEEEQDSGGLNKDSRSYTWQREFCRHLCPRLTTWLRNLTNWFLTICNSLHHCLQVILQRARTWKAQLEYGWQELKAAAGALFVALVQAATSAGDSIRHACRSIVRAILAHPRRMRQEFERWFN
uniref:Envelope glycoprotein gp160 n=1 Tax=Simian immunodeficiency virus TaxID=11723 RepID=O91277_SIV|nr:envelope glycoprotein [Simian immunodeficiency virus]